MDEGGGRGAAEEDPRPLGQPRGEPGGSPRENPRAASSGTVRAVGRWRVPGRRIWRAFPELDGFSDEQCRRFLRVACRRSGWRHLHRLIVGATLVALTMGVGTALGWFLFIHGSMGFASPARIDDSPVWAIASLFATALFVPLLGTLLVRDVLLRRRLRAVLRGTGSCPKCRYSLVGLAIPETLELPCPECGFLCRVDLALSELQLDEQGRPLQRTIVFERAAFWTRERRRRWLRNGLIVAGAIVVLLGTPIAVIEWRVQRQAELANANRPTQQDVTRAIERLRPGVEVVAAPRAIAQIERLAARLGEIQAEVDPLSGSPGGTTGRRDIDMSLILPDEPPRDSSSTTGSSPSGTPTDAELEALARRMLEAYERAGVIELVDEIAATPLQARDPKVPPSQLWNLGLAYLGNSREIARMLGARMALAVQRGDAVEAGRSLAALLAIATHLETQPHLIEHLVAGAIRALAHGRLASWLASSPGEAELDAIDAALKAHAPAFSNELGVELEAIMMREYLGTFFGTPSNVRLLALAPRFAVEAVRSQIGSFPNALLETVGTWQGNRNAIDAWLECARRMSTLEAFQRRDGSVAAAPVPSEDAGLIRRWGIFGRGPVFDHQDAERAMHRTIDLWLALERWRLRHGAYPERLELLVPECMSSLPIDPYSGRSFGYRRIDGGASAADLPFHLWVSGLDGVDDGGIDPTLGMAHRRFPTPATAAPGTDCVMNRASPIPRHDGAVGALEAKDAAPPPTRTAESSARSPSP
ncbi:MAG: hypothetical protein FJ253_00525 [Phycisphaerae bacterium]|nr:hypothetical protein [Phycisphaerae bacterium]